MAKVLSRFNPYFAIAVALPVLVVCYFLYEAINWLSTHFGDIWTHQWGLFVVIGLILTIPLNWKIYTTLHDRSLKTRAQKAIIALAEETTLTMASARRNNHSVKLTFNDQMSPVAFEATPLLPRQATSRVQVVEEQDEPLQIEPPKTPIPTMVRYEDVRNQVPKGHVIVGIGNQGIDTKPDFVGACTWIVGLSRTGKTSTTVLRVEERYSKGHKFLGIDPHFFKPDSLTHAVSAYQSAFLAPMARGPLEAKNVLDAFLNEFNARKSGTRAQPWQPITLLVDEVNALMDPTSPAGTEDRDAEEAIKEMLPTIARICGQEAANFQMGGIFVSQQATGLAWLRNKALMVIVHQLNMDSEKKIAVNNDTVVMKDMKNWPIGRTFVYGVGFDDGPRTVQQPFFEKVIDAVPAGATIASQSAKTVSFSQNFATYREVNTDSLLENVNPPVDWLPELPKTGSELSNIGENGQSGKSKEYLIPDAEKPILINLYNRFGNIDECLQVLKKGARYQKDASRLLKEAGLL